MILTKIPIFWTNILSATAAAKSSVLQYGNYRLCNDCVLLAEVGFELKKFEKIEDLIEKMEDKRLEADCEYIRQEELKRNN